jgi:hypothetical protein
MSFLVLIEPRSLPPMARGGIRTFSRMPTKWLAKIGKWGAQFGKLQALDLGRRG